MMLLRLIDDALATFDAATATPTICIDVRGKGDRLQATLTHAPGGLPPGDGAALANIRERLSGLYGGNAGLEVAQAIAGCVEARLDVPLEFALAATSEEAHLTLSHRRGADPM